MAIEVPSSQPKYSQKSFIGGMRLDLDDTNLESNQYKILFNGRNRFDRIDAVKSSIEDKFLQTGVIQEMVTFGNYEIAFVSGAAFYKLSNQVTWNIISSFTGKMNATAPRYWTCAIPVTVTNYLRLAATSDVLASADASQPILIGSLSGAFLGNIPGLLVQDNVSQPVFIFINSTGVPEARITQKYSEWSITFTDANNTVIVIDGDKREYVPVGNLMAWVDGILYIVSPDSNAIYRSVSGRPLDFVVNVINNLVTVAPFTMFGGGDVTTTAYTVGVGGITCIRALSNNSLFVSASGANFAVSKDYSNQAQKLWGEYTFVRTPLFNAPCLSDRTIIDSLGDTRFISLTGIRSFNAISQTMNEGRNLPFSSWISAAFGSEDTPILQNADAAAAILFNDYELYSVNTVFGYGIAVFDTKNECWCGFDIEQTDGVAIKQFVKIELSQLALYAITVDNKLFRLYVDPVNTDTVVLRTKGVCANILYGSENISVSSPEIEIKPNTIRGILNNVIEDVGLTAELYVNNRIGNVGTLTKEIQYTDPVVRSSEITDLADVNTMLSNFMWATPDSEQGWKCFIVFSWSSGSLTQFSVSFDDIEGLNPLKSQ